MSCKNCQDILDEDGVEPDCWTEKGCILPALGADEARIMLVSLKELTGPDYILRLYGADKTDLRLLAAAEKEINAHHNTQPGPGDSGT